MDPFEGSPEDRRFEDSRDADIRNPSQVWRPNPQTEFRPKPVETL